MSVVVKDGTNPGTRVQTVDNSAIIGQVVVNPDGSTIGGGSGGTTIKPASGAPTDRSGTVTLGGTAQQIMAANATRTYFFFENPSDTAMWINFGATAVATQPSILIAPGASYENPSHFCPNGTVSMICATTSKVFTAKEFNP